MLVSSPDHSPLVYGNLMKKNALGNPYLILNNPQESNIATEHLNSGGFWLGKSTINVGFSSKSRYTQGYPGTQKKSSSNYQYEIEEGNLQEAVYETMVFSAETTSCTFGDPLQHGVPCALSLKTTRCKKKGAPEKDSERRGEFIPVYRD